MLVECFFVGRRLVVADRCYYLPQQLLFIHLYISILTSIYYALINNCSLADKMNLAKITCLNSSEIRKDRHPKGADPAPGHPVAYLGITSY